MSIKEHPELRHVLAHLVLAIEYAASGHARLAKSELDSVRGLVNFTSERAYQKFHNTTPMKKKKGKKKGCH
jgi:hypothetical protein